MANMNVLYQRGNYALQTLCAEISARWGAPSRPYEFVTGYRASDNFTGHNADSNGVAHGVDIFVGPGALTAGQADELTMFLRSEGLKGDVPGHPDRLYYIIYQDRIAGDFSNWEWVGAGYGHWDHVHVSTCDLFWGDPAPIPAGDYDSTAPWGLSITSGQGSNIKPITPTYEEDDMFTDKDKSNLETTLGKVLTLVSMLDNVAANVNTVPGRSATATLEKSITRAGGVAGTTTLLGELAWAEANHKADRATITALKDVISQLAKGQGVAIDYNKVGDAVTKALKDGTITVDVNVNAQKK